MLHEIVAKLQNVPSPFCVLMWTGLCSINTAIAVFLTMFLLKSEKKAQKSQEIGE